MYLYNHFRLNANLKEKMSNQMNRKNSSHLETLKFYPFLKSRCNF